jgi:hypothetical protein
MMQELVFSPPKTRIFLLLLGALAFIALGTYFVLILRTLLTIIIGIVAILFFGACFLFGLRSLFAHGLDLIISDFGITDYQNGFGQIEWDDIEGFNFRENQIFIKVNNIRKYTSRLTGVRKWLNKINGDLDLGLIEINLIRLGIRSIQIQHVLETSGNKDRMKQIDTLALEPLDEH